MKVSIIGGGISGLTCATYLAKKGIQATIFEASDSVGGRLRSDNIDGFILDRGFQIFLDNYAEAKRLLDFKSLDLQSFTSGAVIKYGDGFTSLGNPLKGGSLWESLRSPVGTLADKLRVLRLAWQVSDTPDTDFFAHKNTDTLTFLKDFGWSEKMIETFFRPFLGGVFLNDDLGTSAGFFKFVFKQFYLGDATLPSGGIGVIATQLANRLPAGSIHLNTGVQAINGTSITLANGSIHDADALVLACDANTTHKLLGSSQRKHFNQTICTYFAAPVAPFSHKCLVLNPHRHAAVHHLCVPSNIAPSYAPAGQALISVSTQNVQFTDLQKLTEKIKQELSLWYGEQVQEWRWLKSYSIPEALPVFEGDTPKVETSLGNDVFTCGDWTAYPSLNGAMYSGRRIAEKIIG